MLQPRSQLARLLSLACAPVTGLHCCMNNVDIQALPICLTAVASCLRFQQDLRVVNLDALAERIKQSRLDTSSLITMKSLQGAGLIDTKADRGVKLLGRVSIRRA